jgi:plastocyanin
VFVSGLVHLQLYFDGYRDFPDENLGRSFLLNAVASVVLTVALVFRHEFVVRLAAAVLLVATLAAFAMSRTDSGIFGLTERGLAPSWQAAVTLIAEIVGLVLLVATLVPAIGPGASLPVVPAAVAGGVVVVLAVGGAVLWADEDEQATEPGAANVVSVVDFAFEAATLEVPVGATVDWVNNDAVAHTIEGGSFQSENLAPGDRFTFTFDTAGEFPYFCGIHPSMQGTIVVTG